MIKSNRYNNNTVSIKMCSMTKKSNQLNAQEGLKNNFFNSLIKDSDKSSFF